MKHTDISNGVALADEVQVDLNMLCALVLDRVHGEIDNVDVVIGDKGTQGEQVDKGTQLNLKFTNFEHALSSG